MVDILASFGCESVVVVLSKMLLITVACSLDLKFNKSDQVMANKKNIGIASETIKVETSPRLTLLFNDKESLQKMDSVPSTNKRWKAIDRRFSGDNRW